LRAAQAGEEFFDHDLRSRGLHAGRGRQGYAVEGLYARQASNPQVRVHTRPACVCGSSDVPPALMGRVTERQNRPWLGILFMCIACALFPVQNAFVGYLMFAEIPDVHTWLGSAVIIAAGL